MVLIALGANLDSSVGPPRRTFACALDLLGQYGARVLARSRFYSSLAWPDPSDPMFTNAAACLSTSLTPGALMQAMHTIETLFGRTRNAKNAPRTLDLDLIDYEGRVEAGPPVLPHPRIAERAFVLVPLAEIAPGWRHPVSRETVGNLIAALPDGGRSVLALP